MYKKFIIIFAMLYIATAATAQGPGGGGSTDTIPDGAAYILNNGSTVTLTGETLILNTTQDTWVYTGNVDADSYSNVTVTVGSNVIWNGVMDSDNNALSSTVTVNADGSWTLTGNAYVDNLINNGAIHTAGFTLTYGSLSGSGTIDSGTGIGENTTEGPVNDEKIYTLDGRCLGTTLPNNFRGVYIQNGKKQLKTE